MKNASEFIKASVTFTRLLYPFSVTSKPKKNVNDLPIWQKGLLVQEMEYEYRSSSNEWIRLIPQLKFVTAFNDLKLQKSSNLTRLSCFSCSYSRLLLNSEESIWQISFTLKKSFHKFIQFFKFASFKYDYTML